MKTKSCFGCNKAEIPLRRKYCDSCRSYKSGSNNGARNPICPECNERPKAAGRSYCPECARERSRKYHAANPRKYTENKKTWAKENKEWKRKWEANWNYRKRLEIIDGYGGACTCCGEKTYEFLSIDHVNNDGKLERSSRNRAKMYAKIIQNNFPPEYTILCYNCNLAKGFHGVCPHKGGSYEYTPREQTTQT